jgi:predicted restriction endonuclease
MPSNSQLLDVFGRIRLRAQQDERTPHKPRFLLMAAAHVERGESKWFRFREIVEPFRTQFEGFGPERRTGNPHDPLWHLRCGAGAGVRARF